MHKLSWHILGIPNMHMLVLTPKEEAAILQLCSDATQNCGLSALLYMHEQSWTSNLQTFSNQREEIRFFHWQWCKALFAEASKCAGVGQTTLLKIAHSLSQRDVPGQEEQGGITFLNITRKKFPTSYKPNPAYLSMCWFGNWTLLLTWAMTAGGRGHLMYIYAHLIYLRDHKWQQETQQQKNYIVCFCNHGMEEKCCWAQTNFLQLLNWDKRESVQEVAATQKLAWRRKWLEDIKTQHLPL